MYSRSYAHQRLPQVRQRGYSHKIVRSGDTGVHITGIPSFVPRDTIYSILALARDPPKDGEKWVDLHSVQMTRNQQNLDRLKGGRLDPKVAQAEEPKRKIGLTPNYQTSTRDLFIAFVTRCVVHSGSLDIICRHWAPPIYDTRGQEVALPSWISKMSKAPYGIPGTSTGRQNGENFVAYSPNDQRRRYSASGSYTPHIEMVVDPSLDPDVPFTWNDRLRLSITGTPFTMSPTPSPTQEKAGLDGEGTV